MKRRAVVLGWARGVRYVGRYGAGPDAADDDRCPSGRAPGGPGADGSDEHRVPGLERPAGVGEGDWAREARGRRRGDRIALDLAVNSASERGLLGIALHPNFPTNPGVYLYWTCGTPAPGPDNFTPAARECDESQMLGADTNVTLTTPLLGNRVDRFVWDEATETLSFDKHLISLRSFQADGAPVPPGQGDSARTRPATTTAA